MAEGEPGSFKRKLAKTGLYGGATFTATTAAVGAENALQKNKAGWNFFDNFSGWSDKWGDPANVEALQRVFDPDFLQKVLPPGTWSDTVVGLVSILGSIGVARVAEGRSFLPRRRRSS